MRLRRRSATADDAPVPRDLTGSDSGAEPASARTREVLRRLELDVNQRLDGLLHGDHRGLVPGHGSELGETRSYAPGDDVRRIDWNVTARLSEAHIRETIAERELETWLLLDRSARLDFGTRSQEKRDLVVAAAGAVGFLTNRDGNRIGAMLAGRGAPEILPPRGSRRHLLHILSSISQAPRLDGDGVTDLAAAARQLGSVAKRRGLVVVVSDFWVQPGWEDALRVLARRHEMLAVEVVDPIELELPDVGLLPVRDPATGRVHEVATHKASVREAYASAAVERRNHIANSLRAGHIDHLVLRTDQPWLDDLVRFLAMRRHRMLARAGGRA